MNPSHQRFFFCCFFLWRGVVFFFLGSYRFSPEIKTEIWRYSCSTLFKGAQVKSTVH